MKNEIEEYRREPGRKKIRAKIERKRRIRERLSREPRREES